jgi:hypothetical protein
VKDDPYRCAPGAGESPELIDGIRRVIRSRQQATAAAGQ